MVGARHLRFRSAFVACALAMALSAPAFAADPISIEGDRELYELVLAAQSTHRANLKHGSFRADSRARNEEAESKVHWQGENIRVDFELRQFIEGQEEPASIKTGSRAETATERWSHWPESWNATRDTQKIRSPSRALRLHPQETWFRFQDLMPWERFLDVSEPAVKATKLVVTKVRDDVCIERHVAAGLHMRIWASLALEGRITSYETVLDESDAFYAGEYEWDRNEKGEVYLKRLRWWRSKTRTDKRSPPAFSLDISDFETAMPDSGLFDFDRQKLPVTTKVKYWARTPKDVRTTYIGSPPGFDDYLRRSAATVKGGFASPDRTIP